TASPDFRDLKGREIEGASRYSFSTGGPRASVRAPWSSKIAEDQVFVLGFNADVDAASVGEHVQCVIQGLGESVPVRLVTGVARRGILDALGMQGDADSASVQLVQCKRT